MTETQTALRTTTADDDGVPTKGDRREFLRLAGIGGAALALPFVLAGCGDMPTAAVAAGGASSETSPNVDANGNVILRIGLGQDVSILNYAYALEQLEAAFYTQVIATPYAGITDRELRLLTDVRDHEIAHRDFLKAALGTAAIPALTVNFSSINFASRSSVLTTARAFEDLGVGAYNGAAKYIASTLYLVLAGKIVSVEGRHASAIRDLIAPRTGEFAPNAFDPALEPEAVLAAAAPYISTPIAIVRV